MKSPFSLSSKYNSLAAIIVGVVAVSLLISVLLIRPAWGRLKTLGTEIPQAQATRDQAKSNFDNLEKAKKYFEDNDTAVERINTAIPVQPNVPSVLVILDSLAKNNGVTLTAFTPQQVTPTAGGATGATGTAPTTGGQAGQAQTGAPAGANTVEITANYTGYYESLIKFFYALERNLRIVDVKTISFLNTPASSTAGGTAPSSLTGSPNTGLSGTITFRVYYKLTDTTATAPSPAPTGGAK